MGALESGAVGAMERGMEAVKERGEGKRGSTAWKQALREEEEARGRNQGQGSGQTPLRIPS